MRPACTAWAVLYAEHQDLDLADPLRPAALVHLPGPAGSACYAALDAAAPTYVIGRGQLPGGHFAAAALVDYPTLLAAVRPFWPAIPATPPRRPVGRNAVRQLDTLELADVHNCLGQPAVTAATIRDEARQGLTGRRPAAGLAAAVLACAWLVEHMQPQRNCYALARAAGALAARARCAGCLLRRHSQVCDGRTRAPGRACLGRTGRPNPGADSERPALGRPGRRTPSRRASPAAVRGRVAGVRPEPGRRLGPLQQTGRPGYTAASLARQDALIRRQLSPALYQARQEWLAAVRSQGLLAGTLDYLLRLTG